MMKSFVSVIALITASVFSLAARAGDDPAPAPPIERRVSVQGDGGELASAPIRFTVRRYAGSGAGEAAYGRLEAALADLARSRGMSVAAGDGKQALNVEVDTVFYVFTKRFNARLVRLGEYTQAQLAGDAADIAAAPPASFDALRVAAGALGIVRGWISPRFGGAMISGGAVPALYGTGPAPTRLFVAGRERYERGEQEVNTHARLLRSGAVVGTVSVRCWTQGDEPPFKIDALVADNWSTLMDALARKPETEPAGPAQPTDSIAR